MRYDVTSTESLTLSRFRDIYSQCVIFVSAPASDFAINDINSSHNISTVKLSQSVSLISKVIMSMSMSMSLAALPPELLSGVVANVAHPPTLCNLAQCSRQLYYYTIPYLYRHITVFSGQRNEQLMKLASLLIQRPDLARLVRRFKLDEIDEVEVEDDEIECCRTDALDQALETIINGSNLSEESTIHNREEYSVYHDCPYDLVLASLLPALPQVKSVELPSIEFETYFFEKMIRKADQRQTPFDIQQPFQTLVVFVFKTSMSNAWHADSFSVLLKLPSIREISGGVYTSWDDDVDLNVTVSDKNSIQLDSFSSPLISLDLAAYRLSTADLCRILRAPIALKNLKYMICLPARIGFPDILHALEAQKDSLESFELDCDPDSDQYSHLWGPMPSYTSFIALKVFKTAALFFLTDNNEIERHSLANIIPPNLETLHLIRFHANYRSLLEALEYLLAQKSPYRTPLLKTLILDGTESFDPTNRTITLMTQGPLPLLRSMLWRNTQENAIERLRRVGAAHGVVLHVEEQRLLD